MKALIVTPHLGKGGAEELLVELSIDLSKNHDVDVCILSLLYVEESFEHLERLGKSSVEIQYLFNNPVKYLSFGRRLRSYIGYLFMPFIAAKIWYILVRDGYDVLHVNLTLPVYSLFFLNLYRWIYPKKIKFLETFHTNTHLLKPFSKFINAISWNLCDHLVTEIHKEDIDEIRAYAPKVPISFIPFGYSSGKATATREYFTKKDVVNICTVSRIRFFEKKIDVMLEVVHGLVKCGYNVNFSLCGDGEDLSLVKDIIARENLDKFVTLRGYVDNAREIYSENDIALVATVAGESGVSGMMALDAGCCLVGIESTDKEIEVSALNAISNIIYFSNDVIKLVDFCTSLIENFDFQALYRSVCLRRRASNIENFELFATRYLDLYNELRG